MGSTDLNLAPEEQLVYEVIKRETERHGGIFQTKLKELSELKHLEPQRIARIVLKLARQGLIKRQLVSNNDRSMYFLQAITKAETRSLSTNLALPIRLDTVLHIPCFACRELERCNEGGYPSPSRCSILTKFLISKATGLLRSTP
ncbi:MAG TPA: hypothetical protein EYH02_02620 [Ignisphaera aggregans]|uniref:Uncharacterized protein n=1 Tax=Ignisphaera aggregans TaxID=334771 RepID=A0A833DUZ3_9CREN|nr:hypothetical protein [Ignisphaera aggregans]